MRSLTSLGNYGGPRNPSAPAVVTTTLEYEYGRTQTWQRDRVATAMSSTHHGRQYRLVSLGGSELGFSGRGGEQNGEDEIDADQLRWVDALNSWIPDRKPSQAFVSFVQTVPVKEGAVSPVTEGLGEANIDPCPRFQAHMKQNTELHPLTRRGKSPLNHHRCKSCREAKEEQVEEVSQVQRSHSVAVTEYRSRKSTKVRFGPPCQPSQASSSSLPPAPPPSVTRSRSADSTGRGDSAPAMGLSLGEDSVPPVVPEVTEERDPSEQTEEAETMKSPVLTAEILAEMESSSYRNSVSRRDSSASDSNSHLSWHSSTQDLLSEELIILPAPSHQREPTPEPHPHPPPPPHPRVITPATLPVSPPKSVTPPVKFPPPTAVVSHPTIEDDSKETTRVSHRKSLRSKTRGKPKAAPPPPNKDSKHERTKVRWKIQNDVPLPENVGDNIESNERNEGDEGDEMNKYIETCYGDETERKKILKKSPVSPLPQSVLPAMDTKDAVTLSLMIKPEETQIPVPLADPIVTLKKRSTVIKKMKKVREKSVESFSSASSLSGDSLMSLVNKTRADWIYNTDDASTDKPKTAELPPAYNVKDFALPPRLPSPKVTEKKSPPKAKPKKLLALPANETSAKRSGQSSKDTTYEDELRRQQLAEERRRKQQFHMNRLKLRRRYNQAQDEMDEGPERGETPHFEDFGFLAKYCIFNKGALDSYKAAFHSVSDSGKKSWLSRDEVSTAMKGLNTNLSGGEAVYLRRILELTGYKVSRGADFKLFSVLAALSQKISSLDSWMKNLIGSIDYKLLEMKMFMCKTLWECNVEADTNKITLDQLCVELRAGGVSEQHEWEVRKKMGHLVSLDLLDFLTYVPLFIMIHESVVDNPLCDRREK